MAANMYRVGDYVYFETSNSSPYVIRRIEELNKTSSGNVEAKVICFYRRRDLPASLIQLADRHQSASIDESPVAMKLKKMCLKTTTFEENPSGFFPNYEQTNTGAFDELDLMRKESSDISSTNGSGTDSDLNSKQKHQIKHRELFLSRQMETLPASCIRGKCSVTLLNETEALQSYLDKEDVFFYCLVFDPTLKTLLADKGEIRVGTKYQCDLSLLFETEQERQINNEKDTRQPEDVETLVWSPSHGLTGTQIDQFLVIARSVGTFARALDCNSSVKQPSLHMSAAASSRDITLFHAMDMLHRNNYDLGKAMCSLVTSVGPVLCRDEIEEWSASEANLFEEALEKYGKDFHEIRQDYLPWKTVKSIVEYYYMWKTTDRYIQQKRMKAVEYESKLKKVYIPNYHKMNPMALNGNNKIMMNGNMCMDGSNDVNNVNGKPCESCNGIVSSQWYAWGPSNMQCRLCQNCWLYWKRYGGLTVATRIESEVNERTTVNLAASMAPVSVQNRPFKCSVTNCGRDFKYKSHLCRHYLSSHGIMMRSGSPRPVTKTRHSFTLFTTPLIKLSRKLCSSLIRLRHVARMPSYSISVQAVRQECIQKMSEMSAVDLKNLLRVTKKNRGSVTEVANRIGCPNPIVPTWLILTDRANLPMPEQIFFPIPPKGPDGSFLYEKVPNKPEAEKLSLNNAPNASRKRNLDEFNGFDGHTVSSVPSKRVSKESAKQPQKPSREQYASMISNMSIPQHLPRHIAQINGKQKVAHLSRSVSSRKHVINWMDAPDDVFFKSTTGSRNLRKSITFSDLKRAARKPWRAINMTKIFDDLPMVAMN